VRLKKVAPPLFEREPVKSLRIGFRGSLRRALSRGRVPEKTL
jgi:hypothetical protein